MFGEKTLLRLRQKKYQLYFRNLVVTVGVLPTYLTDDWDISAAAAVAYVNLFHEKYYVKANKTFCTIFAKEK